MSGMGQVRSRSGHRSSGSRSSCSREAHTVGDVHVLLVVLAEHVHERGVQLVEKWSDTHGDEELVGNCVEWTAYFIPWSWAWIAASIFFALNSSTWTWI